VSTTQAVPIPPQPEGFRLSGGLNTGSGLIILVLALTAFRLWASAHTGLVPDETYYVLWSKHPQWGYFDHPPMVSWLIGASNSVFGHSAFAVRLPFILMSLGVSWFVYDMARLLFPEAAIARRAVLWLNASFLINAGGTLATPDPPSVLFFAMGGWAMARLMAGRSQAWWLVLGVAAGLGVEAKYTNFFFGLSVLLWLWMDVKARKAFRSPWFWLSGVIALGLMAPNIVWNLEHGFATINRQFGRLEQGGMTLKYLLAFAITQAMCLNPFIVGFIWKGLGDWIKVWVCPPFDKDAQRPLILLIAQILPMLVYMVMHVLHDAVQGNWPAPIYPALIVLAAFVAEGARKPSALFLRRFAAPFGIGLWALILFYVTWPVSVLNFIVDPTNQMRGWQPMIDKLEARRHETGATFMATTQYSLVGELVYHRADAAPLLIMSERYRYDYLDFGFERALVGQKALIVQPVNDAVDVHKCFSDVKDLGVWVRMPHPARKRPTKDDLQVYTGVLMRAGCTVDDPPEPKHKKH
jgi:4-amino-4-deoxy-L-arabinose transferase-like glycosyltransferase